MIIFKTICKRTRRRDKETYLITVITKEYGMITPIFASRCSKGGVYCFFDDTYKSKITGETFSLSRAERVDVSREVRAEILGKEEDHDLYL